MGGGPFGGRQPGTISILMKTLPLFLLACQASALGQGLIYSFSGHVTDISQDAAGIIETAGIRVGDPLTASFVVDFARPGIYTQNDGTIGIVRSDPHDTIQYHYYYDRLVSDFPIHEKDGGSRNNPADVASWNYAHDNFGLAQVFFSLGVLQGGSDNEYLTITKSDPLNATIATWKVGDSFEANAWAFGSQNLSSVLMGTAVLTGISPVPEPSSSVLLGFGLIPLFYILRRR